jgi:hypothetical protein
LDPPLLRTNSREIRACWTIDLRVIGIGVPENQPLLKNSAKVLTFLVVHRVETFNIAAFESDEQIPDDGARVFSLNLRRGFKELSDESFGVLQFFRAFVRWKRRNVIRNPCKQFLVSSQ